MITFHIKYKQGDGLPCFFIVRSFGSIVSEFSAATWDQVFEEVPYTVDYWLKYEAKTRNTQTVH